MALKSVKQVGSSLVEFMIAALLGGMALTIVGSVFISNQKSAAQRSQEIMLLQQMSIVMQQMKEDIQRAGFDGIATNSMMLSGSTTVLYLQSNAIGYVYRKTSSQTSSTLYRINDDMLEYCQHDSALPITVVSAATGCADLFDPKQIKVTRFSIDRNLLTGALVESAFVTISLDAQLNKNSSVSHALSLKVQQRNWQ
ncbi:pilus assembly protein PilW [Vibrio vulnificus]|uniref:PilW family protein n=1 Tax=Vibrio vulnificus TaxID=672 RepID=UPI000CD0CC04|nr:pilus assembly protein PilW [Vibrio vulnificus]EJU9866097.1 pilus assembly protein PilW [Vibrio vulnificus]EJU9868824.1 pilus assembly protein PilW [Vibrio vulnificus]ELL0560774.1 pilus assembly protein PilW [Vibrio vulnificus]ELL0562055.1 pilus assembly protein PilW [Vibrio vulnificus]POC45619.1 pilus assembly protein PilW [Vibrio vulnificus]